MNKEMKDKREKRIHSLPPPGLRIIKSAAAIFLCCVVNYIRGEHGIVFYSMLAALWCVQVYVSDSKVNAKQRFLGTCVGAVYGLAYLLLRNPASDRLNIPQLLDALILSVMVGLVLYTTVLLQKKKASYFSCVVFLSIVVNHATDLNPYLFVWNRFLDTVIGIFIGVFVNILRLPRKRRKDILFVSGLDDTLINEKGLMSDYSRIELNRMIDEGANFTISTIRTPGAMTDALRDIKLKLPVIAMDGAVLYDFYEKTYLNIYIISGEKSQKVYRMIREAGLTCFSNVIKDDVLCIYYEKSEDPRQEELVRNLRRSPYRNYICGTLPPKDEVVYFMLFQPTDVIEGFYKKLEEAGLTEELKVVKYASQHYPDYSYIKIYSKNAKKENMIEYLKNQLEVKEVITFGTIPGKYSVVIEAGNMNQVVRHLKKTYEPVGIERSSGKIFDTGKKQV